MAPLTWLPKSTRPKITWIVPNLAVAESELWSDDFLCIGELENHETKTFNGKMKSYRAFSFHSTFRTKNCVTDFSSVCIWKNFPRSSLIKQQLLKDLWHVMPEACTANILGAQRTSLSVWSSTQPQDKIPFWIMVELRTHTLWKARGWTSGWESPSNTLPKFLKEKSLLLGMCRLCCWEFNTIVYL